jgi:hypothetical protein
LHNASITAAILAVDAAFSGSVDYAANWANYRNANLTSTLWEHPAIDFMGVVTYHPLTTSGLSLPDVAPLEMPWNSVFDTPASGFNHGILGYAS